MMTVGTRVYVKVNPRSLHLAWWSRSSGASLLGKTNSCCSDNTAAGKSSKAIQFRRHEHKLGLDLQHSVSEQSIFVELDQK